MKKGHKKGENLPRNGYAQAARARKAEPMRHRTARRAKERERDWKREQE